MSFDSIRVFVEADTKPAEAKIKQIRAATVELADLIGELATELRNLPLQVLAAPDTADDIIEPQSNVSICEHGCSTVLNCRNLCDPFAD